MIDDKWLLHARTDCCLPQPADGWLWWPWGKSALKRQRVWTLLGCQDVSVLPVSSWAGLFLVSSLQDSCRLCQGGFWSCQPETWTLAILRKKKKSIGSCRTSRKVEGPEWCVLWACRRLVDTGRPGASSWPFSVLGCSRFEIQAEGEPIASPGSCALPWLWGLVGTGTDSPSKTCRGRGVVPRGRTEVLFQSRRSQGQQKPRLQQALQLQEAPVSPGLSPFRDVCSCCRHVLSTLSVTQILTLSRHCVGVPACVQ